MIVHMYHSETALLSQKIDFGHDWQPTPEGLAQGQHGGSWWRSAELRSFSIVGLFPTGQGSITGAAIDV